MERKPHRVIAALCAIGLGVFVCACSSSSSSSTAASSGTGNADSTQSGSGGTVSGPSVTLRAADVLTGKGQPLSTMLDNFSKDVLADTHGKVNIVVYHNATLATTANVVSELQANAIDIGIASASEWITAIPGFDVLTLPTVLSTWSQAAKISADTQITNYQNEQTKKLGVTMIANPPNSWHDLWTTKPIHSLSDLKGMKIYTAGGFEVQVLKALGAIPEELTSTELYEALLTHTVDGASQSSTGANAEKLYEVAKYGAIVNMGMPYIPLCISNAALAKLSPQEQQIVMADGQKAAAQIVPVEEAADNNAQQQMASHGMTLTHPDIAPFQAAVAPLVQNYVGASTVATTLYNMGKPIFSS
jgi:TRAP-type transport system periplasmic protein